MNEIESLIHELKDNNLKTFELIDSLIVLQLQKINGENEPEYNISPCSEKAMENLIALLKLKHDAEA